MTAPKTKTITVIYSDNSSINMSEKNFKKCLQKGIINGKRNYYIYQNQNIDGVWKKKLILSKVNGIEKRFNTKSPDKMIYEFHLGIKNIVLTGKIYSPIGRGYLDVSNFPSDSIDKIRFGRRYKNIYIEFI